LKYAGRIQEPSTRYPYRRRKMCEGFTIITTCPQFRGECLREESVRQPTTLNNAVVVIDGSCEDSDTIRYGRVPDDPPGMVGLRRAPMNDGEIRPRGADL